MRALSDANRAAPDSRIERLIDWIGSEMVPGLRDGRTAWSERRLLIFTEFEDTRRWVERLLREAVAHTATPEKPRETRSGKSREEIKLAFKFCSHCERAIGVGAAELQKVDPQIAALVVAEHLQLLNE
jgi:hypothetical protein